MSPHEREEAFEESTDMKHVTQFSLFLSLVVAGVILLVLFGRNLPTELDYGLSTRTVLGLLLGIFFLLEALFRFLALSKDSPY